MKAKYIIIWPAVAIMLLAAALRVSQATYGYGGKCLSVGDEQWVSEFPQPASLYVWNYRPNYEALRPSALMRHVEPNWLAWRVGGALMGILTVAAMLRLGAALGAKWWWYGGALIAVLPSVVRADRWIVRFDPAPLAAALACLTLLWLHQGSRHRLVPWGAALATLSLLLVAPPLWWLMGAFLLRYPKAYLRQLFSVGVICLVSIPALQAPAAWLHAAQSWDVGAMSACIVVGLILLLWYQRQMSGPALAFSLVVLVSSALLSVYETVSLPRLTPEEQRLTEFLRARVPHGAVVYFDSATWKVASSVSCPPEQPRWFTAQPAPVVMPFLPGGSPEPAPPDLIVTRGEQTIQPGGYIYRLDGGYVIQRTIKVPAPTDILFGDWFHILSYQLVTPQVEPGAVVDVRIDYQFGSSLPAEALNYSLVIRVVSQSEPEQDAAALNVQLAEGTDNFAPREYALNRHYRLHIPTDIRPGTYDVVFGIYNFVTLEPLKWLQGQLVQIGTVEIGHQDR